MEKSNEITKFSGVYYDAYSSASEHISYDGFVGVRDWCCSN
jgi:hypothetical protein